jgi:hypothetical protein
MLLAVRIGYCPLTPYEPGSWTTLTVPARVAGPVTTSSEFCVGLISTRKMEPVSNTAVEAVITPRELPGESVPPVATWKEPKTPVPFTTPPVIVRAEVEMEPFTLKIPPETVVPPL